MSLFLEFIKLELFSSAYVINVRIKPKATYFRIQEYIFNYEAASCRNLQKSAKQGDERGRMDRFLRTESESASSKTLKTYEKLWKTCSLV